MIKEFALEPDVLAASFRDFSYFIEKFGVSQGRVISRFPKDWKRMVYEAAQASLRGTKELSRIEIRLRAITNDVLIASRSPSSDGTQPWLTRAIIEHGCKPFAAIIARENPTAHTGVLVAATLDDSDARFQAAGQRHITRTAAEIVDCVELLLRASTTVKLIDPHFDPTKMRWGRMLELVLTALCSNGQTGVFLEIHRSDKVSSGHLKYLFDSCIPKFRPAGITVQVFLHPDAAMHNRFILTSVGGASYHTGLDDNEEGESTPTDLVSLLTPDTFATEWATYSSRMPFLVFS